MSLASIEQIRQQFPALRRLVGDQPAIFLDGPAGTQVPQRVIDAITRYLSTCNANHAGVFATSIESDRWLDEAHRAAADFVGSEDPDTIAFGGNATTLNLSLSRALSQSWDEGDEIVVSGLEHDANFTPWILAARDAGVTVHTVEVDPDRCELRLDQFEKLIQKRTRLVAVGCASNAVGTLNPVREICAMANRVGAISVLDAVHYAPHRLIDVMDWQCDFLLCSVYKFFGPHVAMMYGRRQLLETIQPYKLRPAPETLPGRWMTGTQNHEGIAGAMAAIDYLADLGRDEGKPEPRREALRIAFERIASHEQALLEQLVGGLQTLEGFKIWGITGVEHPAERCPTISITHQRHSPREMAEYLAARGIFAWHGNYYALPLTERLGVEPEGMLRLGLVHYNTPEEVDRVLAVLAELA